MTWILVSCALVGCSDDLDPPWQLDHDRIVAIRATPPRMPAETTSQLEVLVASAGATTTARAPDSVEVVSPPSLVGAVTGPTVTAPSETQLATARAELGLATGAPVPLILAVTANGFAATKTVWLGEAATNPPLADVRIDGADPADQLVLPAATDIPLAVAATDGVDNVTWLTSCGTMHDFDLSHAYLRIEPEDPQEGELVLVVRDPRGGVSWRVWEVGSDTTCTTCR
jgi:hypothetical protein